MYLAIGYKIRPHLCNLLSGYSKYLSSLVYKIRLHLCNVLSG
jgi:hypothetical protein